MTLKIGGSLLLVGAGKMGGALLTGWLDRGLNPDAIFIQDPAPSAEVAALAKLRAVHLSAGADALPGPPAVMAVRTACGHNTDTLMPSRPWVMASHSARATAACLVTA